MALLVMQLGIWMVFLNTPNAITFVQNAACINSVLAFLAEGLIQFLGNARPLNNSIWDALAASLRTAAASLTGLFCAQQNL